jgi:chloride channel 3/4/5
MTPYVVFASHAGNDIYVFQIKDISRLRRLRRNKSWRGYFNRLLDRVSGWLIVTVVGFLSAVVAFLIVRSERWLFDFKEGHCTGGWWKSRSMCCAYLEGTSSLVESQCEAWQTWDQLIHPGKDNRAWHLHWAMEYISYTIIAVGLSPIF